MGRGMQRMGTRNKGHERKMRETSNERKSGRGPIVERSNQNLHIF